MLSCLSPSVILRIRNQAASEPLPGCTKADLMLVERIVSQSGTSFARGMRCLPARRRFGMYGIYAFCRLVDDIADDDTTPVEARLPRLQHWQDRVEALYRGEADDCLERVLLMAIRSYSLARKDFLAVIDGMRMDAQSCIVAPDEATLDLYCDRVASAVGRLSVRVFGDDSADADRVAHHLGRALQLTNILRDIAEDASRGRLYLPRELLERFDIPPDPATVTTHRGLDPLCRVLAWRAHDHFQEAEAAMKRCPKNAMKPARLMALGYGAVLARLVQKGWEAPLERVSVSFPGKCCILVRSLLT